jgi:hypothetical protein
MTVRPVVTLRQATANDAPKIAEIWHLGWRDGHLGFVPQELVAARHEDSFRTRAAQRVSDTTVAVIDGDVAGFVMVVGDEVEQVYVAARHRGTGVALIFAGLAPRYQATATRLQAEATRDQLRLNQDQRNQENDASPPASPSSALGRPAWIPGRLHPTRLSPNSRTAVPPTLPASTCSLSIEAQTSRRMALRNRRKHLPTPTGSPGK